MSEVVWEKEDRVCTVAGEKADRLTMQVLSCRFFHLRFSLPFV